MRWWLSLAVAALAAIQTTPLAAQGRQTGDEWLELAPAFCRSKPYSNLTPEQMASCDEAAFRHLSKNWQNVVAANGQIYEVALDTIYRDLPPDVDPAAVLRAAEVVVYASEGEPFNAGNVLHFYFDCHGHFQTFQRVWSPVAYAPPLSVVGKIASVACDKSMPQVNAMLPQAAPRETKSYDPIPEAWSIKVGLSGTLSVGAEYCTESGKCQYVGESGVGYRGEFTQGCLRMPDAEACVKASPSYSAR